MKRTEAETEMANAVIADPYTYHDLIEVIIKEFVTSLDDDQLVDFLWGDDDSQTIEPD